VKWGTVEERQSVGLYEYEGKCGRKPIAYLKVLEKLKISVEAAQEAADKQGFVIDEEHLNAVQASLKMVESKQKREKSSRGRPKKEAQAVEAEEVVDLFAQISAETVTNELTEEVAKEEVLAVVKTKKLSEEERAAKKQELEAAKAQQKQEREDALVAAKAEKEAQLAAAKAEKEAQLAAAKAEKDVQLAASKAEKEAQLAAAKALLAATKAEKEAQLAAKKAEKEAQLAAKKEAQLAASKAEKEAKKPEPKAAKKETKKPEPKAGKKEVEKEVEKEVVSAKEEVKPTKVTVTRIQIEGIEYMKSSANILYNPQTKEEVGIWDPETQTIKELPEEEEEEEEYEDEGELRSP
jgi:hypothetical protein